MVFDELPPHEPADPNERWTGFVYTQTGVHMFSSVAALMMFKWFPHYSTMGFAMDIYDAKGSHQASNVEPGHTNKKG